MNQIILLLIDRIFHSTFTLILKLITHNYYTLNVVQEDGGGMRLGVRFVSYLGIMRL